MQLKHVYSLYDMRYLDDPDYAICFEVCDTLDEAKEAKEDYGNAVIVKETLRETGPNTFTKINTTIIYDEI